MTSGARKMRILHVTSRFWPGVGGCENYLLGISTRLAADGHSVTVATTDADEPELFWDPGSRRLTQRSDEHAGVAIRRFALRHLPLSPSSYSLLRYLVLPALSAVPIFPEAGLAALSRYTPWSPDLWRWVEGTEAAYDLVGAWGILYEPMVAAAHKLAGRLGVPFVVCPLTHLGAGPSPGRDSLSRYYTMRHQVGLVRSADAVVVMTSTEADFYLRHGVPAEKLVVAPPGVLPESARGADAARFRQRHGLRGPLVAFLSSMSRDKGAVHLVEAVRRLWAAGRPVELVMAGRVLEEFERYRAQLPPEDRARVRVLGVVSESEKHDLLAAADILAVPSRTDSFGIAYHEAWLHQKPVIGAQAWAMADVIRHGQDGLLVPFADGPALAAALAALLDDPSRRAALGAAGAQRVLDSGLWEHRYAAVRGLYGGLVERFGARAGRGLSAG